MKQSYKDVRALTPAEPHWYDRNGVPRYLPFSVKLASNIYASQAGLILIQCQSCHARFEVEFIIPNGILIEAGPELRDLKSYLGYGDPPVHHCVGDTMVSEIIKIIEFWSCDENDKWSRDAALEIDFPAEPRSQEA